jgi:hypothetical protein
LIPIGILGDREFPTTTDHVGKRAGLVVRWPLQIIVKWFGL